MASKSRSVLITCNRDDFRAIAKRIANPGIVILVRRRSRALERAALIRLLDTAQEAGIVGNITMPDGSLEKTSEPDPHGTTLTPSPLAGQGHT
jgi:hypothetical protein